MESKNIIISIKPEFASRIIEGEKTIELRRRFPSNEIQGGIAIIYASSPVQKIIGYAVIVEVEKLPISIYTPNIRFLRFFGMNTTGYLQSHLVWVKL